MSVSVPNGSRVEIGSGFATLKSMTAITNAVAAVATLEASHGVIVGDVLAVTSGWGRLTDRVVEATVVATNDVTLGKINTVLTSSYPAGSGTGSVKKVTGWTQLLQILSSNSEGGEQQFKTFQFLEADAERRIPTNKSASGLKFSIADDPSLAGYILAAAANEDRLPRPVRITLPNGGRIYYNAYISLNETPSLDVNEIMACEVTLSLLAAVTRY